MRLNVCFTAQNRSQSLWGWKAPLKAAQAGAATAALKQATSSKILSISKDADSSTLWVACAVHTVVNATVHVTNKDFE